MIFDENVEMLQLAFWKIILISGPFLGVALAVGLGIGIIQAATSINEMTLSFVPKLVIVIAAMALLAHLTLLGLTDYFAFIFYRISNIN